MIVMDAAVIVESDAPLTAEVRRFHNPIAVDAADALARLCVVEPVVQSTHQTVDAVFDVSRFYEVWDYDFCVTHWLEPVPLDKTEFFFIDV